MSSGFIGLLVFYCIIVFGISYNLSNDLSKQNMGLYIFVGCLGFFLMFMIYFFQRRKSEIGDTEGKNNLFAFLKTVLATLGAIGFFIAFIILIYYITEKVPVTAAIVIVIVLVSAAIFLGYLALSRKNKKPKNKFETNFEFVNDNTFKGLLMNLPIYIKCIFQDLTMHAINEWSRTTNTSLAILFIMCVIYALYFLVPWLNYKMYYSKQLLYEPTDLDEETKLGNFEDLSGNSNDEPESKSEVRDTIGQEFDSDSTDDGKSEIEECLDAYDKKTCEKMIKTQNAQKLQQKRQDYVDNLPKYDYNYAISAWVWINPQPPNVSPNYGSFVSILNYANKPNILYNASKDVIQIKMQQGIHRVKKVHLDVSQFKLQRWNNFVLNYRGGILDVFLNGEIVTTIDKVVPYMNHDSVTAGADNGIYGSICNVQYFDHLLTKGEIVHTYNKLKGTNPPLNAF